MDRLATPLLQLFASLAAPAAAPVVRPEWRRHFDACGVPGTFVLLLPMRDQLLVLDEPRSRQRFLPASTFKVASAVIGLETGAIADQHEVFAWDGSAKPRPEWERDQTLATGMRAGTVWMFQEVARRIGKARMRDWLRRLDYGNHEVAGGIDHFWLQGGLRVSAREQVAFLHRLAEGRLDATQRAQRLVREALLVERAGANALYAKAGTTGHAKDAVAWWVGWLERQGRVEAVFAMNYQPRAGTPFGARFAIGRAILRAEGLLP